MEIGVEGIAVISLIVLGISFIFWKNAVVFLMYWILIIGAIRKWLFPGAADAVFFSSHLILTGVYVRFFSERAFSSERHRATPLLFFLIFWCLLSVFNPSSPDIRIGILGIIMYLYFVPLIFIAPHIFQTKNQLIIFLKRYALFSFPLLILGVIQFFSPPESSINQYIGEGTSIATISGHSRITSTFSYISGYGTYITFLSLLLVYLLSTKRLSKRMNIFLYILMALTCLNMFMTGSRGTVMVSIISIIIYYLASIKLGVSFAIKFSFKAFFILSIAVVLIGSTNIGKTAYNTFMSRAIGTEDEAKRRAIGSINPARYIEKAGFAGYGIGTTYQGVTRFGTIDWGDMPRGFENESGRIALEMGLIGIILVYLLRWLFIFQFWNLFKRLKDVDLKLLALVSLLFQLPFAFGNNMVYNFTSGAFYWFCISFLFLLPKLDNQI